MRTGPIVTVAGGVNFNFIHKTEAVAHQRKHKEERPDMLLVFVVDFF